MALITLKKRPLDRDNQTFRDDRLIIIACDDTYAPKQYFNFFRIPRLQIAVIEAHENKSAAPHVLEKLLEFECGEEDERWLLLDTDHCIQGTHLASFTNAIREAKSKNINIALSRSCFEIWLLFHHKNSEEIALLGNAKSVETALNEALGSYNKKSLKKEHYSVEGLKRAYLGSKLHDATVSGGDIPDATTTRVYKIWDSIFDKINPTMNIYKDLESVINNG